LAISALVIITSKNLKKLVSKHVKLETV